MDKESMQKSRSTAWLGLLAAGLLAAGPAAAQTPVDENGEPLAPLDESLDSTADIEAEAAAEDMLSAAELEELVGPIALYPDDLLAVVLPASAYPLQIVEAARFLDELENDKSLEPDESWDSSVTALLNYPEVVQRMNDDLDWTYRLGEAVVRQQEDVIASIEAFRDRAYAAGNLKSDERQTVTKSDGVIEITPVEEEVIYVPYYEPERVVVYQTEPVYHYYARPCPLYYYPYPYGYSFASGYFWGVTTAFTIGWSSHNLHVFHDSYFGHPYYGYHYYFDNYYYRRPSINVYNTFYVDNHVRRPPHYRRDGDFWRPRRHGGALPGHDGYRADYYRDTRRARFEDGYRNAGDVRRARQVAAGSSRQSDRRAGFRGESGNEVRARPGSDDRAVRFSRNHSAADAAAANARSKRPDMAERRRQSGTGSDADHPIRFRAREPAAADAPRVSRVDDGDRAVHFRARERAATPEAVVRARPTERAERETASSRRDAISRRSHSPRSPAVTSMRTPHPASRPEATSRPSMARPATPSHGSRPAPSAAPRISAPRPSASAPAPTSRPAPAPSSRATPRSSSTSRPDPANGRPRGHQQR